MEDTPFNNLPIIIEAVDEASRIQAAIPRLRSQIPHGMILSFPVIRLFKEEFPLDLSNTFMMKIFIKENSSWFKTPLYEEILQLLQRHHLIWSTVTRGIEGFGKDHVIHKESVFSLSSQVPIVIESVGDAENVQQLIPELKKRIHEGLVITYPVQVAADR